MKNQQPIKEYNYWIIASIILGVLVLTYIGFSFYQDQIYKNNYVISKVLVDNALSQVPKTKQPAIVCPMQNPAICFNVLPAEMVLQYQKAQNSYSKYNYQSTPNTTISGAGND